MARTLQRSDSREIRRKLQVLQEPSNLLNRPSSGRPLRPTPLADNNGRKKKRRAQRIEGVGGGSTLTRSIYFYNETPSHDTRHGSH